MLLLRLCNCDRANRDMYCGKKFYTIAAVVKFSPLLKRFLCEIVLDCTRAINIKYYLQYNVSLIYHTAFRRKYIYIYIYRIYIYIYIYIERERRSQWPLGLRRRSTAARQLLSWVRICCVLSGRGFCDELITCPQVLPTVARRCV
jgi:hypothetical protein